MSTYNQMSSPRIDIVLGGFCAEDYQSVYVRTCYPNIEQLAIFGRQIVLIIIHYSGKEFC